MGATAFLVPYRFVPPVNGGHKAAYGFADFTGRERPLLVLSSHNNDAARAPFRLLTLFADKPWKYISPVVFLRLYRTLRRESIKTLILHQHFMGLLAVPLKYLLGLRLMVYVQNIEYQRFRSLRKWWWPGMFVFEWLVYRLSDHLLFISPDDRPPAIRVFGLSPQRCSDVPYGTYLEAPPAGKAEARRRVGERHAIAPDDYLLIFFGPQSYQPNLEAVVRIVQRINPLLREKAGFSYRILICGGGLPAAYRKLEDYREMGIDYLGFVENIDEYVLAADAMLNPVTSGGGVKTKVIESLALGTPVISTGNGARGVDAAVCGDALRVVAEEDDAAFCEAILQIQAEGRVKTPASFYEKYHWSAAVRGVVDLLG